MVIALKEPVGDRAKRPLASAKARNFESGDFMKKFAMCAALALTVVVAFATVTFNPTTGIGFVGKGDVQLALSD